MNRVFPTLPILALGLVASVTPQAAVAQQTKPSNSVADVLQGKFHWSVSEPLLASHPDQLPPLPGRSWIAVKDPSILRFHDRWHLFCSLRNQKDGEGQIRMGYLSFAEWKDAHSAKWHVFNLAGEYHAAAPQVFWFEFHRKWYMVYQGADESRDIAYGPCYSTTDDISDPTSWTLPSPLYSVKPGAKAGLDFWIICDDSKAHLFFTTLDGRMWRAETLLNRFPNEGWSDPQVVLQDDIFEASHIYRLRGTDRYLALIEAQNGSRRYYKAYLADQLDGQWTPLAATKEQPFASPVNVRNQENSWTTSYSHGELIRVGTSQRLEVDPANLQFLFQGVSDVDRRGRKYSLIPWRLGILK